MDMREPRRITQNGKRAQPSAHYYLPEPSESQYLDKFAERILCKDMTKIKKIAEECQKLSRKSEGQIRVDSSHDVEDFRYQGIFSKNRAYLSLLIHMHQRLDDKTQKHYWTQSHETTKQSVDIFMGCPIKVPR